MLRHLSIRDVVLIDRLDVEFSGGLSVLTGETGAGKSILLDSLGLALGARGDAGLVRPGAQRASVTATFSPPARHPARALLDEHDLGGDDSTTEDIVLRRSVGADGRSRAFVNDTATSLGLLRQLGTALVDVHSQFDQHGLADPKNHLPALDQFAGVDGAVAAVSDAHKAWRAAEGRLATSQQEFAERKAAADSLRETVSGLEDLAPAAGEAADLEAEVHLLQHAERVLAALRSADQDIDGGDSADGGAPAGGARGATQRAARALAGVTELMSGRLDDVIAAVERADAELADAVAALNRIAVSVEADPGRLDSIEQRLFDLANASRKHGVPVAALPGLLAEMAERLATLDAAGDEITRLTEALETARRQYMTLAEAISGKRAAAAKRLDAAMKKELAPLKLEQARFTTVIERLEVTDGLATGLDVVRFEAATNPGSAAGPLAKVASGGELSRFMLALKVVLAAQDGTPTLVFDEVDAGVGGATAAAVGTRLSRIAGSRQVLVVTHSPQVAALGSHHWRVAKRPLDKRMITEVAALNTPDRREEIARMLAGSEVTDEARAAADRLMGH